MWDSRYNFQAAPKSPDQRQNRQVEVRNRRVVQEVQGQFHNGRVALKSLGSGCNRPGVLGIQDQFHNRQVEFCNRRAALKIPAQRHNRRAALKIPAQRHNRREGFQADHRCHNRGAAAQVPDRRRSLAGLAGARMHGSRPC
jgi:hypothetical protein